MRRQEKWLLPGEKILVEECDIGLILPVGKLIGRAIVTNYRFRFSSSEQNSGGRSYKEYEVTVPLGSIQRIDKIGHSNVSRGEDSYGLELQCKDMRSVKLVSKQENHSRRPLFENLSKFSFPASNKLPFFAFLNEEKFATDGWQIYDAQTEFKRIGVPNDTWQLSKINHRYTYSETYPALLAVPVTADEELLTRVASFRSKARIPVLSWLHPESQAALCRSSQPLVGVTARRSHEDEKYLKMIIEANAQSDRLFIMDARPEVNAKVNKAKGGGFEHEDAYPNCQLSFLDVQNIHVMRESLRKLRDVCYPRIDDKNWLSSLDDTHWLQHTKCILLGASRIVDKIENHKTSVLVHCSDGWDRTAQLTSLTMIMLDPFYRTLQGLMVLIEKEWCSFGHKFAQRIGHGDDKHNDSERSPVFLQFIDCVYQLMNQFQTAFEFNEKLLLTILDELYSCRFGTFLYNCEMQRMKENVRTKSVSLWSYINEETARVGTFLNPLYNERTQSVVLQPCCNLRRITLWNACYLRYNVFMGTLQQQEDNELLYRRVIEARNVLRAQVEQLRGEQSRQAGNTNTPGTPATTNPVPALPASANTNTATTDGTTAN